MHCKFNRFGFHSRSIYSVLIRNRPSFEYITGCCRNPLVYNGFTPKYSSKNQNPEDLHLKGDYFYGEYGQSNHFGDSRDGSFRAEELGWKKSCNISASFDVEENGDDGSDIEDLDEEGESDDIDDFPILDLHGRNRNRNHNQENARRVGDSNVEDELRHPLVKEVCKMIDCRSAWTPKLEWQLRTLLRSLKPVQVCAVLKSQSDERNALQFFYWADRQWRYRHDEAVYYTMLEVLSKTKLCQGAKRVLKLMARRRIERTPEAFGYVMVSFSRAGHLRKALQILTLMQKAGVGPDLTICNTTVYVLVKANKMEKALRFLKRMEIVGIMPNVISYNCLIKGYCDSDQLECALQLIAEMPSKSCPPDKVSYSTVIAFLCKNKRINEIKELMKNMWEDSKLIPDPVTYRTLVHTLSKHGHADEALRFIREAGEKGYRVDKVEYSAVIDSFCQEGKMDRAKELLNEMFAKGCNPDVVTYTAVMNGFCHVGEVDKAKKLLQEMYRRGFKPNTVSYTALLNGLCKVGKSSEAREMMNASEDGWWAPNVITYSVLMHGYRREGKLLEACNIVREMIKKGFFPTPVDINLIIQSLCQSGKTETAKKFMEECLHKGCAINVVNFSTVIHGFCQKDDLDAALSVLDDMYLNNKHPDAVTYTTVIDALGRKGRIDEATKLAEKMLHSGLLPTPVTYRAIIHRYCEQGRVDDLLKLLSKMLQRQEYRTVYNQVINKLCSLGNLDQAYKLLGKVLRTASKIDARTCNILLESYLRKGDSFSSYKVACRMFKRNLIPDLKLCEEVSKRLILDGQGEEADRLMLMFVERGCFSRNSRLNSAVTLPDYTKLSFLETKFNIGGCGGGFRNGTLRVNSSLQELEVKYSPLSLFAERFYPSISRARRREALDDDSMGRGDCCGSCKYQLSKLYNVKEDKVHSSREFKVPLKRNDIYVGSSHGWLIDIGYPCYSIQLFNPFTGKNIIMPCTVNNPQPALYKRVVLSCDPTTNPNDFVVAAIGPFRHDDGLASGLGLRKQGQLSWVVYRDKLFSDIIFHNGLLYAVELNSRLVTFDYKSCDLEDHQFFPMVEIVHGEDDSEHSYCCLVEASDGGLLLVKRYISPLKFKVFKLANTKEKRYSCCGDEEFSWVETLKLEDNHSIFLTERGDAVTSSSCASNFNRQNCIYFEHTFHVWGCGNVNRKEIGVFHLSDETFTTVLPRFQGDEDCSLPLIWLTPTLC
ncbi:OLC1v1033085C4 [Oldenlandia corymbosa var. corymbosa]|uniref:OLC1v1033085C4 n=1 Tax=Oldenlandia corymbosa var. corymbosa TaxID=529605 RepID=A0AAV1CMK7_OLDCO|nr:OLC1v1033085C4 [Oldenlandia corymbosa var. corymbosa]